jgi:hypothetical protein
MIGVGLALSEWSQFRQKYQYAESFARTSKVHEFAYAGERMEGRRTIHVYEFGEGEKFEVVGHKLNLPPDRLVRVGPDPRHARDPNIPVGEIVLPFPTPANDVASIYAQFYDESLSKGRSKAFVVAGGFSIMVVASWILSKKIRRAFSEVRRTGKR